MNSGTVTRVAFISSFLPRRCGIAAFTSELISNVKLAAAGGFEPIVIAMDSHSQHQYAEPVRFVIRRNVEADYISAAQYINTNDIDAVCLQHEFDLFGGDGGAYLGLLLERLNIPVITTLHSVPDKPSPAELRALQNLCRASYKVVVMNRRAVAVLRNGYDVPDEKISMILHGIPAMPFADSNYYKYKLGVYGRKTILTFGLLCRDKGIEVMLQAMRKIIQTEPMVLYIILGTTHPEVSHRQGEAYRLSLVQMAKDMGLLKHVMFYNSFVSEQQLREFMYAADIYVSPCLCKEQLCSGALALAVGAGRAVVSTPYWAAEELLDDGRGCLVPFGDAESISQKIIDILQDRLLFDEMRMRAYQYGKHMSWAATGLSYWELFRTIRLGTSPQGIAVPRFRASSGTPAAFESDPVVTAVKSDASPANQTTTQRQKHKKPESNLPHYPPPPLQPGFPTALPSRSPNPQKTRAPAVSSAKHKNYLDYILWGKGE